MAKHTHRGICQVCGAQQAVNPGRQALANHGYTVKYGFFNGICSGAGHRPLELEKTLTLRTIDWLLNQIVPEQTKLATDLLSGKRVPRFTKRETMPNSTRYVYPARYIPATREEIGENEANKQIADAAYRAGRQVEHAKAHAKDLGKLIATYHGKPMYEVPSEESKPTIRVGTVIRVGGKQGHDCEVIGFRQQIARGCGPHLNGHTMEHAILKRLGSDKTFATPTRTLRVSAIVR